MRSCLIIKIVVEEILLKGGRLVLFYFRRLTIAVLLMLLLCSFSTVNASSLLDVENHWAESEIRQLVGMGAITGYPDGTYRPQDTITRAEFSSVLWGALGLEAAEGNTFTDTYGHWGQGRIEALIHKGIIDTELYEQHYGPNEPITREEIGMMTVRILGDEIEEGNIPFVDAGKISKGFREYVTDAYKQGIITGYPDNTFRPLGTATRAEAAVMAIRALRTAGLVEEVEQPDEHLVMHFIDVGQGDCILIEGPSGKVMLIDAGPRTAGEKVVSYLKSAGISSIDKFVATHPHEDHIGSFTVVADNFPVKKVYDPGYPHTTLTYERFLTYIDENDIEFHTPRAGQRLFFDPAMEVYVLHPAELMDGANNSSIVLRIDHGQLSFLFTGDAEKEAEQEMLSRDRMQLASEILKVGHHVILIS